MADSSVTMTGLDALRSAIQTFPSELTTVLQAIAAESARRIQADARARLGAQTHGSGATAAAIAIEADLPNKVFRVVSKAPRGRAQNLPLFLEYGTVKMTARPYMHPAAEAEADRYVRAMTVAAEVLAQKLVT